MNPGDAKKRVVAIEAESRAEPGEGGFLTLVRMHDRNRYEDGSLSRPYVYEYIRRRGFDAVAIAIFHETQGLPMMAYRQGIRVPVYFRKALPLTLPDGRDYLFTPEAVAGSLEPVDRGVEGFLRRVVDEVWEEAGFRIVPQDVLPLGGGFFPSHGQSSEKIHLCAVRVDPETREAAPGDGSVNERDAGQAKFRPVADILLDCARGAIEDPKIEILCRRLSLKLRYLPELRRYAAGGDGNGPAEFLQALEEGAGFSSGR
ncbi:MAG: NUDIX hydrolase [Acidobacteriota bacterium]